MLARTERIAHIGSWEWDISTDKVTWSDELFRIFQLDPDKKVPSWAEHSALYHPEDMESLRHAVEASVAKGTPYELELRALRKDGEIRVCMAHGFAEMGPDGRVMRLFGSLQDITERKRAEDAMRESESRLLEVLENSLDASYKRNLQTNAYDYLSPVFARISGYTPDEMKSLPIKTVMDLIHPDDQAEIESVITEPKSGATCAACQVEYRFKHKEGHHRWFHDRFTIMRDPEGQPVALIGSVSDITDRKQAKEALLTSETHLRTLVQTIPDLIWLKDPEGVYLDCNAMFERLFGAEKKDIIGKTDYDFVDRELADFFREHNRKAMAAGKPSSNEEWLTFADDGYQGLFDTIKTPMCNAHGKLIGVLGIARNITDRKRVDKALRESEERYRKAFMTSPDSIVITRLSDGMFVSINKGFTEISGHEEEDVIGKTSLEINIWGNPEDRIKIIEGLKAKGEVRNYEARFLAKDREFYGLMSASIIELNGVPHVLNVTRDITERKRAEEEKAKLEALLQQAQKMESIGSLAGGIAHDLNNILFPITGLSEMLLDDIPPKTPEHDSIEQIYKSAKRGSELVKQILAFSRQSNPKKLPIRIQSILKETLKLYPGQRYP